MWDTSMTGFTGLSHSNRGWAALAVLCCIVWLGLPGAPARADAVDPNSGTTPFGEPVSLEDLDNERARFMVSGEDPVEVPGFAVILMDELGSKPLGNGTGSIAPSAGTITLGGSRTN